MRKVTLGGDRLGSGNKMQVEMHGYSRSNHNLDETFTSTVSPGTLVPFWVQVGLPGDTFDIDLRTAINTLPTLGPLFGRFKVQMDIFSIPMRLYNSFLHNNKLEVGLNMANIKFPTMTMTAQPMDLDTINDIDNCQVNPSSLMAYLGFRGAGYAPATAVTRDINAMGVMGYWDTVKQFYSNKQEEIGAVIHYGTITPTAQTIDNIQANSADFSNNWTIDESPNSSMTYAMLAGTSIQVNYTGAAPDPKQIMINLVGIGAISFYDLVGGAVFNDTVATFLTGTVNTTRWGTPIANNWNYSTNTQPQAVGPIVATFPLANIDTIKEEVLSYAQTSSAYSVNSADLEPYKWLYEQPNNIPNILMSQEGLAVKTYDSDVFNNWVRAEYIDYVNSVSSVSTLGDSFTIDQLNLATKIFYLLTRVAVGGASYQDWVETVYDEKMLRQAETPMWMGGMITWLGFQEVVSKSATEKEPLASLGGKGVVYGKHSGGKVIIKVKEPSILMGIFSLTPMITYSQGNAWYNDLLTMDDLHKPALDQIGFEDSLNVRRAWWSRHHNGADWVDTSAGKVPAWLWYMTSHDKAYGKFAIQDDQMFMTLNRRYEVDTTGGDAGRILDLTTYIDPARYNYIFADQGSVDAMNFWVQIAIDCKARRKMSAKVMPNL